MKLIPIIFFVLINSFIFAQSNEEIETDEVFRVIDISDYLRNLQQKDTLFIKRDTCWLDSLKQTKIVIDRWDSKVMEAKLNEIQQLIKEKYKDY